MSGGGGLPGFPVRASRPLGLDIHSASTVCLDQTQTGPWGPWGCSCVNQKVQRKAAFLPARGRICMSNTRRHGGLAQRLRCTLPDRTWLGARFGDRCITQLLSTA